MPQPDQLTHQKPGFSNPNATTRPTHPPETGFLKSQCHNQTNSPTRNRVSQIPMPQPDQLTHQKPGFSNPNATTRPTHPPETGFLKSQCHNQNFLVAFPLRGYMKCKLYQMCHRDTAGKLVAFPLRGYMKCKGE